MAKNTNAIMTPQIASLCTVRLNPNVTLHLDVEKVSMKDLSRGRDELSVYYTRMETSPRSYNYSPPVRVDGYSMIFDRRVSPADVKKQKLSIIPGFRLTWRYTGMEVKPEFKYRYHSYNKVFIRKSSNNP